MQHSQRSRCWRWPTARTRARRRRQHRRRALRRAQQARRFNLAPEQNGVEVTVDEKAAALVPDAIKADGKLTVVTTGGTAPLSLFATDNKPLIGSEVDIAYAVGETLGLTVDRRAPRRRDASGP